MLSPVLQTEDAADVQVRPRSLGRGGANRVTDSYTLAALRATSGPPTATGEAVSASGLGRRSTSLFDLPRSGAGVLSRLRGQVRSTSPLTAALSGDTGLTLAAAGDSPVEAAALTASDTGPAATSATSAATTAAETAPAVGPTDPEQRRLNIVVASQTALRSALRRADNQARFLQAQSSPWRINQGFGLRPATDQNLFGGGLLLFGGGVSLFG
ncbi:MAG: hypothetical protein ABIL09_27650 [Gemmatimonadota bacterium]